MPIGVGRQRVAHEYGNAGQGATQPRGGQGRERVDQHRAGEGAAPERRQPGR
jgi:hypothetical protein